MANQLIEQVKLNYKQSLPDKARKLNELWQHADGNPADLLSFLHQLAGSAGMYGYDSITQLAADLHEKIKSTNSITLYTSDYQDLYNSLIEESD